MVTEANTPTLNRPTLSKRWLLIWLLGLVSCLVYLSVRLSAGLAFDSSFLALLPANEGSAAVEAANNRLQSAFSKRIILLLGVETKEGTKLHSSQRADINRAGVQFQQSIESLAELTLVDAQTLGLAQLEQQLFYLPYRYHLLDANTEQTLSAASDGGAAFRAQSLARLFSPLSPPRAADLNDDPYGIHQQWLQQSVASPREISLDEYGLRVSSAHTFFRVYILETNIGSFDLPAQQGMLLGLERGFKQALAAEPTLELLRSGMVFHTAVAAKQARKEITTIGVGSLVGVLLLLMFSFRSAGPLLLSVLALSVGVVCALSVSLLVFGRLHMLTLAFGASLVGVSIDYAFHYFCSQQHRASDHLRHILPALSLGLASSVLAYGIQALLPFPGLQQMALFSAVGLVAAWSTVVCVFPYIKVKVRPSVGGVYEALSKLRFGMPLKLLSVSLIFIALLLAFPKLSFEDDVRLLNNSPSYLLSQESRIRKLTAEQGASHYFLVSGNSWQRVLEREEALGLGLDQLQLNGELLSYQAISQSLPSLNRQENIYELLAKTAYRDEWLASYFLALSAPLDTWKDASKRFEASKGQTLTWAQWQSSHDAKRVSQLWFEADGVDKNEGAAKKFSLVLLKGAKDVASLSDLETANIELVDRVGDVSFLIQRYRLHLLYALGFTYLMLGALLALRFKARAIRVVAVPFLSTALVFAGLSYAGIALNLFNVLAALLILGIAMDMGIILQESSHQAHAWKAISLSALTTMLAFGLLALSSTPVLFSFGITLLPGIALAWLLSLLLAPQQ